MNTPRITPKITTMTTQQDTQKMIPTMEPGPSGTTPEINNMTGTTTTHTAPDNGTGMNTAGSYLKKKNLKNLKIQLHKVQAKIHGPTCLTHNFHYRQ